MIKYSYNGKEYFSLNDVYNAVRKDNVNIFGMPSSQEAWQELGVTCIVEDPSVSLEVEKNKKKQEIETSFLAIRNSSKIYVDSSLGFPVNANETAIINIMGLLAEMNILGTTTTSFRDFDNNFHDLTKENLEYLQAEIAKEGTAFYALKWKYEKDLEEATTIKQVKDIIIAFPQTIPLYEES